MNRKYYLQLFFLFLNKWQKNSKEEFVFWIDVFFKPRELVRNVAHEILCIMKDERNPVAKHQLTEINKLLLKNHIDEHEFSEIAKLTRAITDFDPELNANLDDVAADAPQVGVPICF